MSFEERVLKSAIRFFQNIHAKTGNMVHELKYMQYELEFGQRDEDIYVATYLRSGTTWMQAILYQLTTNGDMGFNHIYDVSPWIRNLAQIESKVPQLPSPRIIKTHDAYHRIGKNRKGRFVYVVRDGLDVGLSLYHHERNYRNAQLSWEQNFVSTFVTETENNWFSFNAAWLENKNKLPILYVRYEDLQNNFEQELKRIARFLNVELKEEDLPRIIERSSFQFMKTNQTKFGEQPDTAKHQIVYDQFIRSGKVGEGKIQFTPEQVDYFTQRFKQNLSAFSIMQPYNREL